MKYEFDTVFPRKGTNCDKYDSCKQIFGSEDVIPLWIADMDFPVADFITEAIRKRSEHPIYGYSVRSESYYNAIKNWIERRNGWKVENEWMDYTPGIVAGFTFAIRAFTNQGDGVVINPPVYPPFAMMINANNRRVINNPLKLDNDGKYTIDYEDLDKKLAQAKVYLFCNPHNPTGRVFTREELEKVAELCIKHDVIIISDEIHSDLVHKPYKHTHIASLSKEISDRSITLVAPSKTFNIAGLSTSVAITPGEKIRERFRAELETIHAGQGNVFGSVALEAAYNKGDEWVDQVLDYIEANKDFVVDFVTKNLPKVHVRKNEGTFLLWMDFREYCMEHETLKDFLVKEAKLGMNDGIMFGEEGRCFMRLNVGAPKSVIERAMNQLLEAFNRYNKSGNCL